MYKPSKKEYEQCLDVLRELLTGTECMSNDEINKFVEDILKTSYSIGGSYEKDVITKIAKSMIERR